MLLQWVPLEPFCSVASRTEAITFEPAAGPGGNLYGTASAGGSQGHGVVWEITP